MMAQNLRNVLAKAAAKLPDANPTQAAIDARLRTLDTAIRGFGGERSMGSLAFRVRHSLAGLKTRLRRPVYLRRQPPEEILAAFPDIDAL